jgi:hypothetical protein
MKDPVRDAVLEAVEASLEAQLRAVRRLRNPVAPDAEPLRRKGLSQVDMAFDVLAKARSPLHVNEILERIRAQFAVEIDRDSLVSSLSKKVARADRFVRPAKNTFALLEEKPR